ncbi:MAG: tyrosine-type recombinase/integrase [Hyphomonadaceae bacterium]
MGLTVAKLELRYVDTYRDRHGRRRYYFRRSRHMPRIALPGRPGEPDFMDAYAVACARTESPQPLKALPPASGSVDALCAAYYARCTAFLGLRQTTRATYRNILDNFRDTDDGKGRKHGTKRVAMLQPQHVQAIVAAKLQSSGPHAANNLLRMLRLLLDFAVADNWVKSNAAAGVKPIRAKSDGFETWSEEDIAAFEQRWPTGTRERLALALLLYTGQRRGDMVRMGRQHRSGDALRVTQSKTGVSLVIPMHTHLVAEIDASAARDQLTFICTAFGRPFSAAGFGNWFRDVVDAVPELKGAGLSAHGLRKAAARRLAEAGCTAHQIMAITGHTTLKEVARYTKAAEQERLARDAVNKTQGG